MVIFLSFHYMICSSKQKEISSYLFAPVLDHSSVDKCSLVLAKFLHLFLPVGRSGALPATFNGAEVSTSSSSSSLSWRRAGIFLLLSDHGKGDASSIGIDSSDADLDLVSDGNDIANRVGPAISKSRNVNKSINLTLKSFSKLCGIE